MKLIAHRGNIAGTRKEKENNPEYLHAALDLGFDIEVDLHLTPKGLFLGHDGPEIRVDDTIFSQLDPKRTWWHAKNAQALEYLKANHPDLMYLFHRDDECTLASNGYIWVHPKTEYLPKGSICVLPEWRKSEAGMLECAGICTDFVERYKEKL